MPIGTKYRLLPIGTRCMLLPVGAKYWRLFVNCSLFAKSPGRILPELFVANRSIHDHIPLVTPRRCMNVVASLWRRRGLRQNYSSLGPTKLIPDRCDATNLIPHKHEMSMNAAEQKTTCCPSTHHEGSEKSWPHSQRDPDTHASGIPTKTKNKRLTYCMAGSSPPPRLPKSVGPPTISHESVQQTRFTDGAT